MTKEELCKKLAATYTSMVREGEEPSNYANSYWLPKILDKMTRDEKDVEILLSLPGTTSEVASKVALSEEEAESRLKILEEKALAFLTRRGWFPPRNVVQFHNACLCNPKYDEEFGKDFFYMWEAFGNLEYWTEPTYLVPFKNDQEKVARILPDRRALPDGTELAPWEDLLTIFETTYENDGKLGLMPCSCKRAIPDDPTAEDYWTCIVSARSFEWNLARGTCKPTKPDELLELIDKMHEQGMITQGPNFKDFATKKTVQMFCNCGPNHCDNMIPAFLRGIPLQERFSPSRYVMTVKSTKDCQACQRCVGMCIFGAAQMKRVEPVGKFKQSVSEGIAKYKAWVDPDKCMGCGNCALVCPIQNRVLELVRPPEYVPDELQITIV